MYRINERYFSDRYPVALQYERFTVYDVARPAVSGVGSTSVSRTTTTDRVTMLVARGSHDFED